MRFSSSDGSYECSVEGTHTQNIRNPSTRSHPSEVENRTRNRSKNCMCKQAFTGTRSFFTTLLNKSQRERVNIRIFRNCMLLVNLVPRLFPLPRRVVERAWVRDWLPVRSNLVPRACDPWEGNEGSGIIRCRKPGILAKIELRIHFNGQSDSSLKRIIPEPSFPSQGSQARGTRLG